MATADINANSAAQLELDGKIAAQGNNYLYVNGKSFKYNENTDTWKIIVYGMRDEAMAQERLEAFNTAVDAISDPLTADDADAIVAARAAYDALTPYALTLVETDKVAKLVNAEAAIGALVDQAAAKNVADMIDALTNDSTAEEVVAASNAYDNLTVAQKAYISEAQLAALQAQVKRVEEAVVQAKANAFKAKVDALGTPKFPKDKNAVEALESEYNALGETVQAKLAETKTKLDGYVKDAAKYIELQATFGSDRIRSTFSGYNEYYLVIYNPKDEAVNFYYSGEASSWKPCGQTTLPGKSYTQIVYDERFVSAGNAYVYGDGATINFNDTESGWICKVYGRKTEAGAEVVALSVNGTVDDPTYGKVLLTDVKKPTDEEWGHDNGGYLIKWGSMTLAQIEQLKNFDNVYVYVYNPSDVAVGFYFSDNVSWGALDRTVIAAKSWARISLSQLLALDNGFTTVYVNAEQNTEGFVYEGWMISDFYGTAK